MAEDETRKTAPAPDNDADRGNATAGQAETDEGTASKAPKMVRQWRRPYTFDRVVRMVIGLALLTGAILLVDRLSGVLLPFLVSWLIAYLLEPVVQWNRRLLRISGRIPAIVLTLLEVTVLIVALGYVFIPGIIDEIHQMAELATQYAENRMSVSWIPAEVHNFLRDNIDFRQLAEEMNRQDLNNLAKWFFGALWSGVDFVVELAGWLIVLLYVVFIMVDYERLLHGFRNLVPPRYRKLAYGIGNDVIYSMNHYFRGQALISLIVGILFAIGFSILGLPMGIGLGLFIGWLNMVPYLQLISLIPCTLLCIVFSIQGGPSFLTAWIWCMVIYCVVQAIQDLFLTPKIMGKYMGLNPAVILLSLSVWGSLLGLVGLIIALPLTTLLLSYYNRYIIGSDNGGSGALPTAADRRQASDGLKDITLSKND